MFTFAISEQRRGPTTNQIAFMKTLKQLFSVLAAILAFYMVTFTPFGHPSSAEAQSLGMPENEKPKYTADGQLIPFSPDVFREWIWVGEPLTPNDLNDGEANFPEFHDVYINPTAWREWKKSGTFPEGTVLIKELTSVGSKKAASGNGYFQGEFTGLEHAIKDTKRFPAEAKGWGYFSFGHKYPLKKQATLNPVATCAACHVANAQTDMVFTQYYPVLRAGKGK
jgi:Cytochrome P460